MEAKIRIDTGYYDIHKVKNALDRKIASIDKLLIK